MPRQPRLIIPDVAVHIVQRGNNRTQCFRTDGDFQVYLSELRRRSAKFDCAVHAYCLMSNHVHLLVTPARADGCTGMMKELSQAYAWYFNQRHERTGTLWEGRFRSCMAQSARYVLACYRYIELNPVRAGIVPHPELYPWSSYAANCGTAADTLVTPHAEFIALASEERARPAVYRALLGDGLDRQALEAIRAATHGGYPLASGEFKGRLKLPPGRSLERARAGRRTTGNEESVPDTDLLF
jgi:putative transposase